MGHASKEWRGCMNDCFLFSCPFFSDHFDKSTHQVEQPNHQVYTCVSIKTPSTPTKTSSIWRGDNQIEIKGAQIHVYIFAMKGWFLFLFVFNNWGGLQCIVVKRPCLGVRDFFKPYRSKNGVVYQKWQNLGNIFTLPACALQIGKILQFFWKLMTKISNSNNVSRNTDPAMRS